MEPADALLLAAGRLIDRDPDRAREELASIEQSARTALSEVRQAISGFNEQTLDQALEQARLTLRAADVELDLKLDDHVDVPLSHQAMLSLVIREAVTNVLRHAAARICRIRLCAEESGGLRLAEGTVRNYLSEAIGKLNADNRIEAFRIARDQGWL